MSSLAVVAETHIREAIESGEPDRLANLGKVLNLEDYFAAPASLRAGFGFLKSANVVPPEVEAMKLVANLREELAACTDPTKAQYLRKELLTRETELIMGLERIKRTLRADATL
jgi:hypothetical protein